jgi:hypothetical protein
MEEGQNLKGRLFFALRIVNKLFGNGNQSKEFVRRRWGCQGDSKCLGQIQGHLLVAVVEELTTEKLGESVPLFMGIFLGEIIHFFSKKNFYGDFFRGII